jgi:hypothetical protein
MLAAADLLRDGKLVAPAIAAAEPVAADLVQALTAADGAHYAALAVIAGRKRIAAAAPRLLAGLGKDGVAGRAAAWALGQLAAAGDGTEAAVLAAIADGKLDTRENGYLACATLAARGVASATLATVMAERVLAEIERAKAGGSGLGEHACRVLAVLGAERTATLIQQVIDQDRFCDRFELQRLRKAVADGGRDQETIRTLGAWNLLLSESIAQDPPAPKTEPAKPAAPAPAAKTPTAAAAATTAAPAEEEPLSPDDGMDEADPNAPPIQPIPWAEFKDSAEGKALPAPLQQLAGQLGPLLEQLSMRAIRAPLTDLNGQEFAALLLQVLPQAMPPQHVQMALSPQAITCYKALVSFLHRTGRATHGQELIDGVKLVRQELTKQIRQAGILNGPDYSDPDDKPAPPAKP